MLGKLKLLGISLVLLLAISVGIYRVVAQEPPVVVVLGDSLSAAYGIAAEEGWVALLAARLAAKKYPHRVINESISGDTTANGLSRLRSIIARHRLAVLVVELGANDGLRGYPIAQMKRNLQEIILVGKQAGAQVLLIGITIPNNYGKRYREAFEAVYRELAQTEAVSLVPSLVGGVPLEEDYFQEDYLHPSALAQPKMLENVWQGLVGLL